MLLGLVINERLNAWRVSGPFVPAASACVFFENFDAAGLGGVPKHRERVVPSWIRLKLILKIRRKFWEFWEFSEFVENFVENFGDVFFVEFCEF